MTAARAIAAITLRGLAGRRRMLLMLVLVALPVLVGVLLRLVGGGHETGRILDALVIRTVLPLVALVIGTAAIGSEIEDGTIVYLLVKPIPRWRTAVVKAIVAAALTAALVVPPVIVTGLLVSGFGSASLATTIGFALAALVGGTAYAFVFTALGTITSRALLVGLVYTLLWEGVLAGLLEGTRYLSIRGATLGLAAAWSGDAPSPAALAPGVALVVIVAAIGGAFAITAYALARFQVRSAD